MTDLNFFTDRLQLKPLSLHHCLFILELVNTAGWLRFIGNRNIRNELDASDYIQKILDNPNTTYWVVELKETPAPIGIITLIKRDYLEHHDIGFAFLPSFSNKGYAFEAANTLLTSLKATGKHERMLATTIPENVSSIKLLRKLGLEFDTAIVEGGEQLYVYSVQCTVLPV